MATSILGTKIAIANPTLRSFDPYNQYYVKPTTPVRTIAAGYIESVGLWIRAAILSKIQLGVYAVDAAGQPISMLARTAIRTYPSTQNVPGYNIEEPLDWVNMIAAPGSIAKTATASARLYLSANTSVALVWLAYDPSGSAFMEFGSSDTTENNTRYERHHGGTYALIGPFESTGMSTTYEPGIYAVFTIPVAPTVALANPTTEASITDDTPEFSGTFATTDAIDTFLAYQVEVWENAGPALLRDSGIKAATSTQKSNKTWQYIYDGPDLVPGITYKWKARVQGTAGGWSVYAAFRTFSIPTEGVIDLATSALPVSGSKIDRPDLLSWAARWYHTANHPMDAVQIKINDANEVQVNLSGVIPKAVTAPIPDEPPGKEFTVSQAEAAGSNLTTASLTPGKTYHAHIRGKSATNQAWSAWAGPLIFRTNALAGAPVSVSPADESAFSTLPELIVRGYDPDTEDVPGTDTIWEFEVLRVSTNTIVITNAGAYVPGSTPALNEARLLLTSTQVPAFGAYRWRARSVEAAAGAAGTSVWTGWLDFSFNKGPTVAITAPLANGKVPTSAMRVAWTNSEAQKFYQVQIFQQADDFRRYMTIGITSPSLYHDVPLGKLLPNVPYYARVTVWNLTSIQGTSSDVRFTIVPGAIVALTNVLVSVRQLPGDVEPTTPVLSWNRSAHPTDKFRSYLVRRYITTRGRTSAVLVAQIPNIAQLSLRDYHAPPGVDLTYLVSQQGTNDAGEVTESPAVTLTARVDLTTPVIVALASPNTNRFPLMWQQNGPPSEKAKARRTIYQTWGAEGKPTVIKAPGVQETRGARFTIITDEWGSAPAKRLIIKGVVATGSLVSYRNGTDRLWMDIADHDITPGNGPGSYDVTLSLEETAYREPLG